MSSMHEILLAGFLGFLVGWIGATMLCVYLFSPVFH